jgi:hypothetical protein
MFFASMLFDPSDMSGGIIAAAVGAYLVFLLILMAIIIIPFWFILKKAGFSPWLALVNLVPFGTLIMLYVLAFAQWKVVPAPQPGWQQPPPYPPQV